MTLNTICSFTMALATVAMLAWMHQDLSGLLDDQARLIADTRAAFEEGMAGILEQLDGLRGDLEGINDKRDRGR